MSVLTLGENTSWIWVSCENILVPHAVQFPAANNLTVLGANKGKCDFVCWNIHWWHYKDPRKKQLCFKSNRLIIWKLKSLVTKKITNKIRIPLLLTLTVLLLTLLERCWFHFLLLFFFIIIVTLFIFYVFLFYMWFL